MKVASKLATTLALAAIRGYQRYLSPYKGFSCALAVGTGGASCSAYGHAVIARFGLKRGLGLLDRRMVLCGHVHRRMAPPAPPPVHPRRKYQQGFCDAPCDGHGSDCDLPCGGHHHHGSGKSLASCACDLLDATDGNGYGNNGYGSRDRWRDRHRDRRTRNPHHLDAAAERIRRQQEKKRQEQKPRPPHAGE